MKLYIHTYIHTYKKELTINFKLINNYIYSNMITSVEKLANI